MWVGAALFAVACSDELGSRVDQYANVGIPIPITVKSVRNIAGGAVIKVTIPDDPSLKGIVAEYERGGEVVNTKISRYVDSLTVEGFADTNQHTIMLYSFNVNEERSSGVSVDIKPLTPAILAVTPTLLEAFGGLKIHIQNNWSKSDLAVCVLRDLDLSDAGKPLSKMKWVEVTTLFTSSEDIYLSRRGIDTTKAIFGVYLRDHWGNISDTTTAILKPYFETRLVDYEYNGKKVFNFKDAKIADDNCIPEIGNESKYPISSLWDGSGDSSVPHFFASEQTGPSPTWLTIDLGHNARLSRITTLPRIGYVIFGGGAVREYEFWGSPGELQSDGSYAKPSGKVFPSTEDNPYGFDPDVWFCLGKFMQAKPSGYLPNGEPGSITTEDRDTYNAGNDFELDREEYPRCYDEIRYLRVVFVNTFNTFTLGHNTVNRSVQTGEITPFGQPIF